MKSIATVFGAAVITLLMAGGPAMAQYPGMSLASGLPNSSAFHNWAKGHPKAAAKLEANPSLMYSKAWRQKHPHFQHFIENHPGDWKALKQNSSRYFNPAYNNYLSQHPAWGNQVRQNPELMYDPAWRAQHPQFSNYMKQNPNWWQSTPGHPYPGAPVNPNTEAQPYNKHLQHHEWMEHHHEEKVQRRQQHWQKWQQKHGDTDND